MRDFVPLRHFKGEEYARLEHYRENALTGLQEIIPNTDACASRIGLLVEPFKHFE